MELRPAALVEASMTDLLRQLGQAASGREGIPVNVTVDEPCDLPAEFRITLYRIAQEALNNVVKHAQASQVDVTLCCTQPLRADETPAGQGWRAELRIRDDGLGFDPGSVSQDRLGLGIMRERAESIHAQLEVRSEPGSGTEIAVVWAEHETKIAPSRGDHDE
jgi:signal transduction histidine kinase